MSDEGPRPRPAWLASIATADQLIAYQQFALRVAALYHNQRGSVQVLSEALGYSKNALNQATRQKGITPETAIKLETLLGRSDFPREFFRPDIFLLA